jgi:hypothetical protein
MTITTVSTNPDGVNHSAILSTVLTDPTEARIGPHCVSNGAYSTVLIIGS